MLKKTENKCFACDEMNGILHRKLGGTVTPRTGRQFAGPRTEIVALKLTPLASLEFLWLPLWQEAAALGRNPH